MKAIRFKLISLLACLLIATSLSIRPSAAQSSLAVSTRLEIRPQHIVSAYRPSFSGAEEKPPVKLVKEPEYNSKRPRYGRLTVGNAKEKKDIVVANDEAEGEAPRVYIDSNNNRDLTDDGGWSNAVAKLYRVTGIPHQLIIDQKGVIRMITGGADASGSKLERIHKTIEELLEK
jgi:hypothetical protein